MSPRLRLALEPGGLILPDVGRIGVFHPAAGADLSALPQDRCVVIQPMRPDHDVFADAGYTCVADARDLGADLAMSIVLIPRAKALARALIAQAMQITSGPVVVDGAKTDGIDSLLKDMRKRTDVSGVLSKAHGKVFWAQSDPAPFADWIAPASQLVNGFVTAPGVFSADGIDPASQLLADTLPAKLGRHVADLGAGWGYLSSRLLAIPGLETLDLVEADAAALACARQNVTDPRAQFHWADALTWVPGAKIETVVMNPPFHTGRAADPGLGRGFIAAAARMLVPSGQLWMVANRHLPYETTLAERFAKVTEVAGNSRFKILHAIRPSRPGR